MNKTFTLSFLFIVISVGVFGQVDRNIQPKTVKLAAQLFAPVPEVVLPPFSKEETDKLDYNDEKNGHMPHFWKNIPTDISLSNAGVWSQLPDGGRVWRVKISAAGALGLVPLIEELYLPEGASLHAYMPGREETNGAFTHENTPEVRAISLRLVHGPVFILEYYEPASQIGKGILNIKKIGYAYRWVDPLSKSLESGSNSCEVNVKCSEGDNWQNQIRAVVRIEIMDGTGGGFCSGSLINNVRMDCTPYVMSAQHCTEGGVTTTQYNQWVFDFNYQGTACSSTTATLSQFVNGCKKIADSEDHGGDTGSDFLLLKLNSVPLTAYNVYYEGWDMNDVPATSGVMIHHPAADIKKISTFTTPAVSSAWLVPDSTADTHWMIIWATTANGHGVSEPGSSGSPLFNSNGLAVGHLTGGASCCTVGGCNGSIGPLGPDFFGKLYFDWMLNGSSSAVQMKPWLDPDNTGTTSMAGMNPPCGSAVQNDAGIQAVPIPSGNICSGTFTPDVVLRNFGGNTLTSVTLTYTIDGSSFTPVHWTGSLQPGGTIDVSLPSVTLTTGNHNFAISTSVPNGTTDGDASNNVGTSSFYIAPSGAEITLTLYTDNFGSQTTWQLADAGSNVIASGGPYADAVGGQTLTYPICVIPGCFTFTIFDSQGDGVAAGGGGYFQITGPAGSPLYAALNNSHFGTQEVHQFCVLASGIDEISAFDISINPNPSSGLFNVGFVSEEEKTIKVFDAVGRLVVLKQALEKNFTLDLSAQSAGVYILQVESKNGSAVKKLVVR